MPWGSANTYRLTSNRKPNTTTTSHTAMPLKSIKTYFKPPPQPPRRWKAGVLKFRTETEIEIAEARDTARKLGGGQLMLIYEHWEVVDAVWSEQ